MPSDKIILACSDCKNRNYFTTKNKRLHPERVEWKKYCPRCNKHISSTRKRSNRGHRRQVDQARTSSARLVTFYQRGRGRDEEGDVAGRRSARQTRRSGSSSSSLFIGVVIWLMDLVLQQVLVRWIPSLFGG